MTSHESFSKTRLYKQSEAGEPSLKAVRAKIEAVKKCKDQTYQEKLTQLICLVKDQIEETQLEHQQQGCSSFFPKPTSSLVDCYTKALNSVPKVLVDRPSMKSDNQGPFPGIGK